MLPQFGYIVAQAGADYYNASPTLSVTNSTSNTSGSISALAPILNNKNIKRTSATSNVILPPPTFLFNNNYQPKVVQQPYQNKWQENNTRKEYNEQMDCLDNEFWEQNEEIYKEKLLQLENELMLLQTGTHAAFQDRLDDYENKREKMINEAEIFMKYQINFIESNFEKDIGLLEDEYKSEKKTLTDSMLSSIEDTKEEQGKRNLRKRNNADIKSEPMTKKRSARPSTLYNIYAISSNEEEEIENEYLNIKKLVTK